MFRRLYNSAVQVSEWQRLHIGMKDYVNLHIIYFV
jgi:hypothetical protein